MCGGTHNRRPARGRRCGLSPRVRGNHRGVVILGNDKGSIPACAGEPAPQSWWAWGWRVYPRVCGGTPPRQLRQPAAEGLSPRVRGNLDGPGARTASRGSIPACAGEPRSGAGWRPARRVYPRVCGGTDAGRGIVLDEVGLSPRVRGNPRNHVGVPPRRGSIPACAGEPGDAAGGGGGGQVYPRVCGGTPNFRRNAAAGAGLSPRVRGNLCPAPSPAW